MKTDENIDTLFQSIVGKEFSECQARHNGVKECSVVVVALLHNLCDEGAPRKVCQNTVNYVVRSFQLGGTCGACGNDLRTCWRLMPL